MGDEIVTYVSGKCIFTYFMEANDGTGAPGAGNSNAKWLEQKYPPDFPDVFCTCVKHRQQKQKAKVI